MEQRRFRSPPRRRAFTVAVVVGAITLPLSVFSMVAGASTWGYANNWGDRFILGLSNLLLFPLHAIPQRVFIDLPFLEGAMIFISPVFWGLCAGGVYLLIARLRPKARASDS
jgi:hypothetical protein